MANVIPLQPGEDPPNGGTWIMVVLSDEHSQTEIKHHSLGITMMGPPDAEGPSLARAQAIAVDEGIADIYLRRPAAVGRGA